MGAFARALHLRDHRTAMPRSTLPLLLTALLTVVAPAIAADAPRAQASGLWDTATVATVTGVIQEVAKTGPSERGRGLGLHAMLKTSTETLELIIGPAWFAEQQGLRLKAGDNVEVTGSRVSLAGKPALVAGAVKTGDTTTRLRDDLGRPLWRGGAAASR